MVRRSVLPLLAASAGAQICGNNVQVFDTTLSSNGAFAVEWTNAATPPTTYNSNVGGTYFVDAAATDQTTGALPGGNIRMKNIGRLATTTGFLVNLDLIITASPSEYAYTGTTNGATGVILQYAPPTSASYRQLIVTGEGYSCLAYKVPGVTCSSASSAINPVTGMCNDGTTAMKGAAFTFTFVQSGPSGDVAVQGFDKPYYLTFFDVDGAQFTDTTGSGITYGISEFVSVREATDVFVDQGNVNQVTSVQTFGGPDPRKYAIGSTPVTTGFAEPVWTTAQYSAAVSSGMATFLIGKQGSSNKAPSTIQVDAGARHASPVTQEALTCFAFSRPNLNVPCPPAAPPPLAPPPPFSPTACPVPCVAPEECSCPYVPTGRRSLLFGNTPENCVCRAPPSNRRRTEEVLIEAAEKINAKTDLDAANPTKPVKYRKMRDWYMKHLREKRLAWAAKHQE